MVSCALAYANNQTLHTLQEIIDKPANAEENPKGQPSPQKLSAHVQFIMTLQNCFFCSASKSRSSDNTNSQATRSGVSIAVLSSFIMKMMAHCKDLLVHFAKVVADEKGEPSFFAKMVPGKREKLALLLLNNSVLALLPLLVSLIHWFLRKSDSKSIHAMGEDGHLCHEMLALLQHIHTLLVRETAMWCWPSTVL